MSHSAKFLSSQRNTLRALQAQICQRLRLPTPMDKSEGRDSGDFSVADTQASLDLLVGELNHDTLREIESALKRMDAGKYGVCEATHELIPIPRLQALPFARYTVQAQKNFESYRAGRTRQTGVVFEDAVEEPAHWTQPLKEVTKSKSKSK